MDIFPFDKIRPEQDRLMFDISKTIKNRGNLIAHAPTGLGKTAASLSPALEHALKNNLTVFILTSRNTQHNLIVDTLKKINKKKQIIAVDFVGKKNMCPHMRNYDNKTINFSEYCKNQRENGNCELFKNTRKGNKFKESAIEFKSQIVQKDPINVEKMVDICYGRFCAYELSMLLARNANVIIADYYHIFNPNTRRFFLNKIKKKLTDSILIIDEAHNLPDRIRNLLTSKINTFTLRKAAKDSKKIEEETQLNEIFTEISNQMTELANKKITKSNESKISQKEFIDIVEKISEKEFEEFANEIEEMAEEIEDPDNENKITQIAEFLKNWLGSEKGFIRIIKKSKTKSGKKFVSLEYNCLSPRVISESVFEKASSSILMSGTLSPGEMYRDVLGLNKETIIKYYKDPFPNKNRLVLVSSDITTRYQNRNEQMYKKIATSCAYLINNTNGNSAVFFPSYFTLNKTLIYLEKICKKKLFIEKQGLTKKERSELISEFKKNVINGGGTILGVQGANFSEGIDLPGDLLKSVAIVGIPFAPPDLRQKEIINYYDKKFNKGWEYGYIFPAVNRALQAAGRCIRSATDKGVIALLDRRFTWSKYSKIIPPNWSPKTVSNFSIIRDFLD